MDRWLDKFDALKPKVVFGYARPWLALRPCENRKRRLRQVAGVFTTAESFTHTNANNLQGLRCGVFDCYGSSEVVNIASECPHGRMHVNTDFVVLEVDRAGIVSGEPVPSS